MTRRTRVAPWVGRRLSVDSIEAGVKVVVLLVVAGAALFASFSHVHDWTTAELAKATGSTVAALSWLGWVNAACSELVPLLALLSLRRRLAAGLSIWSYPLFLIIVGAALSLGAQLAWVGGPAQASWAPLLACLPAATFMLLSKLVVGDLDVAKTRLAQLAAQAAEQEAGRQEVAAAVRQAAEAEQAAKRQVAEAAERQADAERQAAESQRQAEQAMRQAQAAELQAAELQSAAGMSADDAQRQLAEARRTAAAERQAAEQARAAEARAAAAAAAAEGELTVLRTQAAELDTARSSQLAEIEKRAELERQLADERAQRVAAEQAAQAAEIAAQAARDQAEAAQRPARSTGRTGAPNARPRAADDQPVTLPDGSPVPVIEGVTAPKVAAVLAALAANSGGKQEEIAAAAGVSVRTVRTVIAGMRQAEMQPA